MPITAFTITGGGDGLRKIREECGKSLAQVAAETGWDKPKIVNLEKNRVALSLAAIMRIAEVLECAPEAVLFAAFEASDPNFATSSSAQDLRPLVEVLRKRS